MMILMKMITICRYFRRCPEIIKPVPLNENESVSVEVVSDYQLSAKDLFLNENEYAIELALKKIFERLILENTPL